MKSFSIVVAIDEAGGIGKKGGLAWHLPADLIRFKKITSQVNDSTKRNAIIMGRKTWESLPEKFRPLPGRRNIVLTSQPEFQLSQDVFKFADLNKALEFLSQEQQVEQIFIIGGGQLYSEAIHHPACHKIYATHLEGDFNCDIFFPKIPSVFKVISTELHQFGDIVFRYVEYQNI